MHVLYGLKSQGYDFELNAEHPSQRVTKLLNDSQKTSIFISRLRQIKKSMKIPKIKSRLMLLPVKTFTIGWQRTLKLMASFE
jgi:hypothetical protein